MSMLPLVPVSVLVLSRPALGTAAAAALRGLERASNILSLAGGGAAVLSAAPAAWPWRLECLLEDGNGGSSESSPLDSLDEAGFESSLDSLDGGSLESSRDILGGADDLAYVSQEEGYLTSFSVVADLPACAFSSVTAAG